MKEPIDYIIELLNKLEQKNIGQEIIDIFNIIPFIEKIKYEDDWGAAMLSSAYYISETEKNFPYSSSYENIIINSQKMGILEESKNYYPNPNECIIYNDFGEIKIGIVLDVKNNIVYFAQGNYTKKHIIAIKNFEIGNNMIKGYIIPKK